MTQRLALTVAALLALLLLAACNGEEQRTLLPATTTTATATATMATATATEATATATSAATATATATTATATATSAATATATAPIATATATSAATAEARPNDQIVASTVSTPLEQLDIVEFTNSEGRVATLPIEVPPRSEYNVGLSGRYTLGERGMLFHYPGPRQGPFWMKNTHIDLAIAFIDEQFLIVEIRQMSAESLELIAPASQYRYAVEAPSGWYAERAIEAGDQARFLFELPDG